ncbi:MAG TPA: hypothetical protein VMF32_11770 [Xanthobacteraceae bacterium]|nr:hypothetical protein [Xanthobacteraceae bacterium]
MPDDIRRGEVIKTTVGEVAVELARRGLDPHSHVTVTIDADELNAGRHEAGTGLTGAALIAALQASPYRDIEIEPPRERLPVRDVTL